MKIIVETTPFTNICLSVQRTIPAKAVLPHLEGILIETQNENSVKLTGFDLDIALMTSVSVKVMEAGAAVLNAKTFCDILRHLPEKTATITCNEKNICTITSGEVEYTLISLNPAEYPELPVLTEEVPLKIRADVLKDMIKRTVFSVAGDDGKSIHRGVKFEVRAGEIHLVALDGFRLAIRNEFIEYNDRDLDFTVPAKSLYELIRLAENDEEYIDISRGRRHIMFNMNGFCMISKLYEGQFLNYSTAFPKGKSATVRVNTKNLIDCIERTSIIITEKVRSPLRFLFEDDELKLSAITALGSAHDKMSISLDGERTEIGFNNRYFLDALRSCDTDEVLIELNGPLSPAVIIPPEGNSFLYLILPVRIKND